MKLRKEQRIADGSAYKGRSFTQFPSSLIFLFRLLGLLRGLGTQLNINASYIEDMGGYAKLGLLLEREKKKKVAF